MRCCGAAGFCRAGAMRKWLLPPGRRDGSCSGYDEPLNQPATEGDTMNFLGAVILAVLFLLAVFTLVNWSVLSAPATLSFIAFDVEGPLGVILLGAMLALVTLFVLYALTLRTRMLMESRRQNQALEAQRKLAETAEASRLSEMRTQIEHEFAQLHAAVGALDGQMQQHEASMKRSLDEAANGLAALVAEMDDKVDRVLARNAADAKGS
jgi:uncharacterized integral membrane protein